MIVLVTGGQRSGKSNYAERLLRDKEKVAYIATSTIDGKEMEERVKIHRASRPSSWRTIEKYKDFLEELGDEDFYLFECLGTMTSNIMFDHTKNLEYIPPDLSKKIEDEVYDNMKDLIEAIKEKDKNLIIVSNEVGFSLTPINHFGRVYTDILGRINQKMAAMADEVYLVVAGIEMRIK